MFDQRHDIHQVYLPYYENQGPLKQRLDYIIGVKHLEFPQIYAMNTKWPPIFKERGFDIGVMIN